MSLEALKTAVGCYEMEGQDEDAINRATRQLEAVEELLSALKSEKPAIGGRVGRAIKRCEER